MKKYIDRKILETLIAKYGAKAVNNAINRLNENNENPKSGIFIEYHDHLRCDAFRILVLDNGVNVLKNDPLEVEVVSGYTGKRYIAKLESKYNNDYIEVDFVHSYSEDLCLVKAVKELHAKYSNLPIYCFTEGFYTFKGEYKNVQKFFNDIFSKYLRGLVFEFIPGTMGEFLKNNNMNESSKTNIVNKMAYEYDYNRLSDCPLTYNAQLDFKEYFIKRSKQEGYKFNKNIFYFDGIDCVDTKTSRDIPGVKANKTLNFDEAYNRLLKYFLNNSQEQVKVKRNNDRMLLESLVRKYGKNGVKNAIKTVNESLSGSDYVEAEQIIRVLVDNQEQLNKLINKYGEPTPEFERILNVYDEYVLDVFYDILEADDYEWVAERAKRMAEDNEWENGTEATMLIDFLTDVANEINVDINENDNVYGNNKLNESTFADAVNRLKNERNSFIHYLIYLNSKDNKIHAHIAGSDDSEDYIASNIDDALRIIYQNDPTPKIEIVNSLRALYI